MSTTYLTVVTESVAYEALRLAQVNEHKGQMATSAQLAAEDAMACFNEGDFVACVRRATDSLGYSLGMFNKNYQAVAGILRGLS